MARRKKRKTKPCGSGKKRIEIKYIKNNKSRQQTFCKRRNGLMKRAYQLHQETAAEIFMLVTFETGQIVCFASDKFQKFAQEKIDKELREKVKRGDFFVTEAEESKESGTYDTALHATKLQDYDPEEEYEPTSEEEY